MRRLALTGLILALAAGILPAVDEDDAFTFTLDRFSRDRLPGGWFFPDFFENLAPDTISLIEESNGFSLIDTPRIYFEGNPVNRMGWFLGDVSIASFLEPGGPAISLPIGAVESYQLRGETPFALDSGFSFVPADPGRSFSKLILSGIYSELGGYWKPVGEVAINPHAASRSPDLYETRRKPAGHYLADYAFQKSGEKSSFHLSFQYMGIRRQFNDFHQKDIVFTEDGKIFSLFSRLQGKWLGGDGEIKLALGARTREYEGAELGRYPEETWESDRQSGLLLLNWAKGRFRATAHAMLENEQREPRDDQFSKDLLDLDGEGFLPFERMGKFSSSRLGARITHSLALPAPAGKTEAVLFADIDSWSLNGDETSYRYNPVLWNGEPYQVLLWGSGEAYRDSAYRWRAGLMFQTPFSRSFSLAGRLLLQDQGIEFGTSRESLHFLRPEYDLGLVWQPWKKTRLVIAYGESTLAMTSDSILFLEDRRPGGAYYYWNDGNGDRLFQEGEEEELFANTGPAFHRVDPDIRPPRQHRFLLGFSTPLSRNYRLHIKGLYKKITDPFWVHYGDEYGNFQTVDERELYVLNQPVQEYVLGNPPGSEREPFYAQIHFNIRGGVREKWFFSFSFLAHIGMGATSFGNGAGASDIGFINESMADPNTLLNSFGRLDGDRAFVGRIFYGWYLLPKLFLSGSIKYRDGDPFAFIDHYSAGRQQILVYKTIKAEDERGIKGGPREDCLWDFNIQAGYDFTLWGKHATLSLGVFNIFDFGSELSENVFSGGARESNELQLGRTMRLSLQISF